MTVVTVYALAYGTDPIYQVAIRAWGGSQWHDLTFNVNDFVTQDRLTYISDVVFWQNALWIILVHFHAGSNRVLRLDNEVWTQTDSVVYDDHSKQLDGFTLVDGKMLVHGSSADDVEGFGFMFWEMTGTGTLTDYKHDFNTFPCQSAVPRGVIISPTNPKRLVIGDAFEDLFGYFDVDTKTFHSGSQPGGSCIFAIDVDKFGTVWAGDFGRFYYYSTDGGVTFSDAIVANANYPETWDMANWSNHILYAVGCNPCKIIRRTNNHATMSMGNDWEEVYHHLPGDIGIFGIGFMSSVPESPFGGQLIVGFGGEPYYYTQDARSHGLTATVFAFDGKHLADIGGGLNWLGGVHRLYNDGVNNLRAGVNVKSLDFW